MKKLMSLMVFVVALGLSPMAYAITQNGIHLTIVGTGTVGTLVYVGIVENPNNCLSGGIYFRVTAELNKALAVALAAKVAGKTVRIDYNQPGGVGTECTGTSIFLE